MIAFIYGVMEIFSHVTHEIAANVGSPNNAHIEVNLPTNYMTDMIEGAMKAFNQKQVALRLIETPSIM